MLEELLFNTTQRLVAAEQENECLTREKIATQEALWSQIVWLGKQNEAMQNVDENKQEELKGLLEQNAKLTEELEGKSIEIENTETCNAEYLEQIETEYNYDIEELEAKLTSLRKKHEAKKSEIIRQGVQITVIENAKALAETTHKEEMKILRTKAVTWRRQGSFLKCSNVF